MERQGLKTISQLLLGLKLRPVGFCPICKEEKNLIIIKLENNEYQCPDCKTEFKISEDKEL